MVWTHFVDSARKQKTWIPKLQLLLFRLSPTSNPKRTTETKAQFFQEKNLTNFSPFATFLPSVTLLNHFFKSIQTNCFFGVLAPKSRQRNTMFTWSRGKYTQWIGPLFSAPIPQWLPRIWAAADIKDFPPHTFPNRPNSRRMQAAGRPLNSIGIGTYRGTSLGFTLATSPVLIALC